MRAEIVPAVLGRTTAQFRTRLRVAQSLARVIHLDLMDGQFVPTRSPGAKALARINLTRPVEVHCMLERPQDWLQPILRWPTKRVILHAELRQSLRPLLALFRSHRMAVNLAVNPNSPIRLVTPWIRYLEGITVMGVRPGAYGSKFEPGMIQRVRLLHRRFPRLLIACDGGITDANIRTLAQAGARRFAVGSFLLQNPDPSAAFASLRTALQG